MAFIRMTMCMLVTISLRDRMQVCRSWIEGRIRVGVCIDVLVSLKFLFAMHFFSPFVTHITYRVVAVYVWN